MGFSIVGYVFSVSYHFMDLLINCFFTTVPLVSRILPSDVCKIYKSGSSIRLDTTLVDFSDMRWERGDISFIFRGDKSPHVSVLYDQVFFVLVVANVSR